MRWLRRSRVMGMLLIVLALIVYVVVLWGASPSYGRIVTIRWCGCSSRSSLAATWKSSFRRRGHGSKENRRGASAC
jgi:hypothetical protein